MNLLNILRDPIWTFVVGIASLIVPLIITLRQSGQKKLVYEITSTTQLPNIQSRGAGKLKILYDEKPVEDNLTLLLLQVKNGGRFSISKTDYEEEPLKFSFGKNSAILSYQVVKASTEDIGKAWKHDAGELVFGPILLNTKEEVVISVLLTSYTGEPPNVKGHLFQGSILRGKSRSNVLRIFFLFGSIFIAVGLVFFLQLPVIIAAVGIIGVVLLLFALLVS